MHWRIFAKESPHSGESCIVGRLYEGKVRAGIFTYYSIGDDSYWESKSGNSVKCHRSDNWCPVQSVIDAVVERIEEETENYY